MKTRDRMACPNYIIEGFSEQAGASGHILAGFTDVGAKRHEKCLRTAEFFFAMTHRCLHTATQLKIRHLTPALSPFEAEREKIAMNDESYSQPRRPSAPEARHLFSNGPNKITSPVRAASSGNHQDCAQRILAGPMPLLTELKNPYELVLQRCRP